MGGALDSIPLCFACVRRTLVHTLRPVDEASALNLSNDVFPVTWRPLRESESDGSDLGGTQSSFALPVQHLKCSANQHESPFEVYAGIRSTSDTSIALTIRVSARPAACTMLGAATH